jgi:hypothetical protein
MRDQKKDEEGENLSAKDKKKNRKMRMKWLT